MDLSNDLISQFVKATKDESKSKEETILYGTIVANGNTKYVRLDGSNLDTPISTTTNVNHGDRVTVTIKNHSAIVTGNLSSPSAGSKEIDKVATKVTEFEILVAYKVTTDELSAINATIENLKAITAKIENIDAVTAEIETLQAKFANLDSVTAKDAEILNADIEHLEATIGTFTDISTEDLEAINAEITNLKGYTADFTYVSAEVLSAMKANINDLEVKKLDATFVNIDFSNIDKAAINELYAQSGLIENVTMENGTVTGYLVGVTIKGDLIEGGTIVADKLVIKGEDGLYYKLNTAGTTDAEGNTITEAEQTDYNSLNGQVIAAKSITASKISVSDLVAFGATIGGFHITDKSLYSGVKESIDNSTRGVYLDNEGQIYLGDETNFLRYYKDVDDEGNEVYRLEISAETLWFGANSKSSAADLKALTEHIKMGVYTDPETNEEQPYVELAEGDSDFKQRITNTHTEFLDGEVVRTKIDMEGVTSENVTVEKEFRHGEFVWAGRANGNYGLMWKGANN